MTTYNTAEIIQSSLENVNSLKNELARINEIREGINSTIKESRNLVNSYHEFSVDLTNQTNSFTEKNYNLLRDQILLFQEKIIDFNNRIQQIDEIDFRRKFENSSTEFFSEFKLEVKNKIQEFDVVSKDLTNSAAKIGKVDLESHFNQHSQRLSDIFNAINNINSSLLVISDNLNKFLEKLNQIDSKVNNLKGKLESLQDSFTKEANNNKKLSEEILKKQKSNFIVFVSMFALLLILNVVFYLIK